MTTHENTAAQDWSLAVPARKGWVARYARLRDRDDAVWGVSRPLAGWSADGTALVAGKDGRLIPATEYRPDVPNDWDRSAFMSVDTDDLDSEIGAVPGQGWTLRSEDGGEYPVIAFLVGPHGAKPVCVMSVDEADTARVYTPARWREMRLVPSADRSTPNGDPR